MVVDLCPRCERRPIECGCEPGAATLEWSTERAYSHGENVVSLRDHRHRRDRNRHIRENWGNDDNAA